LVTGLLQEDWSLGVRRLTPAFCIWIVPVHPKNYAGSLAVSTTTVICGPVEHMFSNLNWSSRIKERWET
jgi:hypothetical protein